MQANDGQAFRDAIAALYAAFGCEVTEAIYSGYWLGLSDMAIGAVQQSVAKAIRTCKFLPKPAELREIILGSPDDKAIIAWGDFSRAVGLGPYKHVDFEDRLINATVRNLGGWPTVLGRLGGSDEEKWVRQEFIRAYKSFQHSGVNGSICDALPGLNEVSIVDGKMVPPIPRRIPCNTKRLAIGTSEKKQPALGVSR